MMLSNFLQSIFSIKHCETNSHKVISVCFLKIKLKSKKNNHIYLIKDCKRREVKKIPGLKVEFRGSNAIVEIGMDPIPNFVNAIIIAGDNSYIKIESSKYYQSFKIYSSAQFSKVEIGENFSCSDMYLANRNEPNLLVKIGDDCMFSSDVYIRASDGHSILDADGNIINKPSGIVIGNHVWCCNSAKLLKAAIVADNSIVANSAIVTKCFFKSNVILAGIPAKIIKTAINWDRRNSYQYERENNDKN